MTYVAAHALGLAALLLLFHVTGVLVARVTGVLDDVGRRTGLIHISVGIVVWAYLLMALAWVGLFRRGAIIGAAGIVGLSGLVFVARGFQPRVRGPQRAALPTFLSILACLAPAIVVAQLFVRTLGPWLGWDDMTAHVTLPRLWLAHGGFVHLPFNVYSHWPSNVQLLYGLGLAIQDYVLAKLLHLAFLVLLIIAVYRFAARSSAPWAGAVAASLLLANDVVLVEAPVANIDIAVAFFFFMAVALAVEFRETGRRSALVLAGLFCGAVAGSKITGLGAIACVLPLILIRSVATLRGSGYVLAARDAALFAASALALALPWVVKSYIETGDPLYPVLWKYFGGIEWSNTINEQFWTWQNSIGMGRTPRDYLLLPVRVILWGGGGYETFAARISKTWIVFLPMTIVFLAWVPVARRCLLPAAISFLIWASSSQQTRFLISVLPLLAVATAVTAVWVVDRMTTLYGRHTRVVHAALVSVVTAGALVVLGWVSRYVRQGSLEAARNLVVDPPNVRAWTPDSVYAFVRQRLPPSATVMMLNINHGFFLDRDYIADSFFEASQLNEAITAAREREGGLARFFGQLGITHALVDQTPWVKFPRWLWTYLDDPANARQIYRGGGITVYEVNH